MNSSRVLLTSPSATKMNSNKYDWQLSPIFDKVLTIIDKNRRALNELFIAESNN